MVPIELITDTAVLSLLFRVLIESIENGHHVSPHESVAEKDNEYESMHCNVAKQCNHTISFC